MIYIRADANEQIGTGHAMRCLSVADAFLSVGKEVVFITADHRGDDLIKSRGHSTICLNSNWKKLEEEVTALNGIVSNNSPEVLLVDSYCVTENYLSQLSSHVKTAYIDDMNSQKWDVDYLINYNIFADVLDYSMYIKTGTRLLLGPEYAPLREEFKNLPKHTIKDKVSYIMVSAGGADPERITELIMDQVCPAWKDVTFHFIVGALNPRLESIKERKRDNIVLHINERNMSGLMKKCDIAISAAGTTLYELCACGIPTITYTLADNQLIAAEQFGKRGVMMDAGDSRKKDSFIERITAHLETLINDRTMRDSQSARMQETVDGNGAKRLVEQLLT